MFRDLLDGDLPARLRASSVVVAATGVLFLGVALVMEGLLLWDSALPLAGFYVTTLLSVAAAVWHHALRYVQALRKGRYLRATAPDALLLFVMLAVAQSPELLVVAGAMRTFYALYALARSTGWGRQATEALLRNPALATVASFAAVIAVGTVLLALPRAATDLRGIPLIDAFFTSVSATCVTGLTVVNTHGDVHSNPALPSFSLFGQIVLLLLIQAGGLGIMTLSAVGAVLAGGGRVSLRGRRLVADLLDHESPRTATGLLRSIVVMTFAFEATGAFLLAWRFSAIHPGDADVAAWHGVFHAVSAFCNAGFSLFGDSLAGFRADPLVNGVIGGLIIAGGLGFPTLVVLGARRTWKGGVRGAWWRLPIHARLALLTSALLLVGGMVALLWLDGDGGLAGLPWGERALAACFQSVSARTAGFNTIDMARTTRAAVVVYLFLMFVGASPGGTGGGIKTTTFALLLLSVRATLRGRADVVLWGRTVEPRTLVKVSVITLLSFAACLAACLVLLATQDLLSTEQVLFETASAYGTVGLSMGATPSLDTLGKVVISLLMYLGRVGPLTLTMAVGQQVRDPGLRYPEERVIVG